MKKSLIYCALLSGFVVMCVSQAPAQSQAVCAFENGNGFRVQYTSAKDELKNGKIWTPGNQPFTMFTDTPLSAGNTTLPIGAYGLYVIPDKKSWTLIVSKEAKSAAEYDKAQDLVRLTMEVGDLGHDAGNTQVATNRTAPTQCNLRIYAGKWMAFGGELSQK